MIRPFTCLCLVAACGAGLYLYSAKHRTALLDREISRTIHETEAARNQTGLLHAEWALLNEPERLQDMASKYTTLQPMTPSQFVPLSDLAEHLPPPAPPGTPAPADQDSPTAGSATPVATLTPSVTPSLASHDDAAHPRDAHAATPPALARAGTKPADKLLARSSPRPPHHVALARSTDYARDTHLPRGAMLPLAAPQPTTARVFSTMARPMRLAAARPAIVSAVPSYPSAAPMVRSSLGGRSTLPPPVPYGQ